jgi:predicted O-linked N-acetylglucosamine transferase (SPINDLY family)
MTFKEAFHLALQNLEAGNLIQAENICRQILQQRPGDPNALHLLGAVVHQTGRLNLAVDLIYRAAQADPRRPDVFNNLGAALNDLGRIDDAIVAYRHALRLDPQYAEAYNNLAISLCGKGLISESIDASRRAIQLKPDYAQAHGNLAGALAGAGRLDESFAVFENAFALAPDNWSIRSNYLFMLPFHPAMLQGDILKKCLQWNDRFAAPLRGQIKPHANDRDPNRRLRIGYVSPDFRDHCQSFFMIPLLSAHDRAQYEIYCYSSVGHADATTERIRLLADAWRDVARQSDAAVAEAIRSDRIDILVDLTMHMARGRPLLFAHKPAPVQIAWLAYPGTTGISAIDYRFSDPYLDPPENGGADYSEKTVTLPDTFWCYDPLTTEPQVGPLPAVENGYITFGCLNNFCKINRGVLELWAEVLTAVDGSKLFLLAPEGMARERAQEVFSSQGISPERIEFTATLPRPEYLKNYHRIDVGLDTIPYNGHTTSLDSYWMGVPVVTLVGSTVVGRAGLSQLSNLQLPELIAHTPEQFVEIAAGLARDIPRLTQLRATLRGRLQDSPLMNAKLFARNIEAAYCQVWRERP